MIRNTHQTIFTIIVFIALLIKCSDSFTSFKSSSTNRAAKEVFLNSWSFAKGMGNMQELGNIGSEGEYYFHPSKTPSLKCPGNEDIVGKQQTVPIFPSNNVLVPLGTESLNCIEMKRRHLIYDVGDGLIGLSYYCRTNQKLGLVGTLARVEDRKILPDGRMFAIVKGVKRFFLNEYIEENPYFRARVRTFTDYTETTPEVLDKLERSVFNHVRINYKLVEMLYSDKNYSMNPDILRFRPPTVTSGVRTFLIPTGEKNPSKFQVSNGAGDRFLPSSTSSVKRTKSEFNMDLDRRSSFTFAVMDMLQISPGLKLSLLQEHVLERRLKRMETILEMGQKYLINELENTKVKSETEIKNIISKILENADDIEGFLDASSAINARTSYPENFIDRNWVQRPVLM